MSEVEHINPAGLHSNPGFTQVVVTQGPGTTVYIGGQNAVDVNGEVIGKGDMAAQSKQTFANLQTCLQAAGANLENVVLWRIHVLQGQPFHPGFEAFQAAWGERPNPPAITMTVVAGLAHPDFLIEIEAIAFVPG